MVLFNASTRRSPPRDWYDDLVHYVHKGGNDGSLSNHRPLALIEVLRNVFTGIVVDRMRRDWSRLNVLDECNPGFQAGRTTANAILPVRTAAEYCVATKTEMAVLLDELKWCFDTPANAAIELALMRLGMPAFYVTMLNDIDMHSVKSMVTAAGLTLNLASHLDCRGVHRQLHVTGQGTVEGPLNWLPVADIAIAVARAASTNPPSPCRRAAALRLRCRSRCTWMIRRSSSRGPSRSRSFGRWST